MGFFSGSGEGGTVTSVTGTAPISVATGTTTPVISLDNTAVTPGSYTTANITVDAKGRLTAAANGTGGITNSAPANTIPVTTDGSGNLGDSKVTSDGGANPIIGLNTNANGNVSLRVVGVGGQLAIRAAAGDATHVGGEINITSGNSTGQSGGAITIATGTDEGGGDGGALTIKTGSAAFAGLGGSGGEIQIKAGGGARSDTDGGRILITGGDALDGLAGSIILTPGNSTNGSQGSITAWSANTSNYFDMSNDGFYVDVNSIDLDASTSLNLRTATIKANATVTAAGTTGAQTINKSSGSVNFAAAATSLVVTNSTVTPDSLIFLQVEGTDATFTSARYTKGTGSFTITANAAATAETRVNFWIVTPQ